MKIENIEKSRDILFMFNETEKFLTNTNNISISLINGQVQEMFYHLPETYKQRIINELRKCVKEYNIILRSEIEEL